MANILSLDQAGQYTPGNAYAAQGRLNTEVGQLAPLATTYHVQQATQPVNYAAPSTFGNNEGNLAKAAHFFGTVGSEVGHLVGQATSWLGHQTVNLVEAPVKFVDSTYHFGVDAMHSYSQGKQVDELAARVDSLNQQYKSGQVTKDQYQSELNDITKAQGELQDQIDQTTQKMKIEGGVVQKSGIDTAATIVTIATGGLGAPEATAGERLASTFLLGKEADPVLMKGASAIGKLATTPEEFAKLSPATQAVLQRATAEILANQSIKIPASQIAKSVAINMALKYPLNFWWLSGTGNQIFTELDNKKYGDAVRTLAFNAALLLSGGPIGYALSKGGALTKGIAARTFGQTSFWDELSKFYGDGSVDGFAKAVQKVGDSLPANEREEFYKNLSAVEHTNVNAVDGNPVAAANRLAKGMRETYGFDLSTVPHEDAVHDMVNFAKWQRVASEVGKANGLGEITVGRIDARDLNKIATELSTADSADARMSAWEQLKADNPNQAWANNKNFDTQMVNAIKNHEGVAEFDNAIRNIKAQVQVKGFPKSVLNEMSKQGYIPIEPNNLEAPFKEGTGKITSSFGQGDFWTKTVQPLPILNSVGALLTSSGLSPLASTQRVYEIFNENLSRNLVDSGVVKNIMGEDAAQTADTMIKQLSNYARNPTVGKISKHLPITDLRQMTTKDIQAALNVTADEASTVKSAISKSMIQVPLDVRGLGDKVTDLAYPALRKYLRVQGAGRFSWNPFFQAKVITKTEVLTESEGGGILRSIFSNDYKNIDNTRNLLRENGVFSERGRLGDVISGEAADNTGAASANLTHKLLPLQEKSIAGLVQAQADRMSMDVQTYIKTFPEQVKDTTQMIVQYDRRSQFLNSPLARTLNVAIFPFRFETKVATIMARNLAKSSMMTQVAVVKGLMGAHQWLNSPEGRAWYQQNSEAIGLFKYFVPVSTLSEMFNALGMHPGSIGELGELGGLPFGWIPQLLDSEGITHFNQPGVNAKTGQIYTQYVPDSAKGQVATALQDLLLSLFSYPGATAGLPSKTSIAKNVANGLTGVNKNDFTAVHPSLQDLSPESQAYAQQIQMLSGSLQSPSSTPVAPGDTVNTKPLSTPLTIPKPKAKGSSGSTTKKKKADFMPSLLPGQTQLGQLP